MVKLMLLYLKFYIKKSFELSFIVVLNFLKNIILDIF